MKKLAREQVMKSRQEQEGSGILRNKMRVGREKMGRG
jgi:hypothetical protein